LSSNQCYRTWKYGSTNRYSYHQIYESISCSTGKNSPDSRNNNETSSLLYIRPPENESSRAENLGSPDDDYGNRQTGITDISKYGLSSLDALPLNKAMECIEKGEATLF
jgi:hypothetical protein